VAAVVVAAVAVDVADAAVVDVAVADVAVAVVQVVPAVRHRNRARSWENATVLRKSSRARAYRVLRFITVVLSVIDGIWMPDVTLFL
jgi:hypothetical protein